MTDVKIDDKTQAEIDEALEPTPEGKLAEKKADRKRRNRIFMFLNCVVYLSLIVQAVFLYQAGLLFHTFAGGSILTSLIVFPMLWITQRQTSSVFELFDEYICTTDGFINLLEDGITKLSAISLKKGEEIERLKGEKELLQASVDKLSKPKTTKKK